MKPLYLVAPQAALDLVEIWRYIQERSSIAMADRVESVILNGRGREVLPGLLLLDRLPS
jgi:hypothetical protein